MVISFLLPARITPQDAPPAAAPACCPWKPKWDVCGTCTLVLGALSASVAEDLCRRWQQQGVATGRGVRAAWAVRPRLVRTLRGGGGCPGSGGCLEVRAGGGAAALEISVCVGVLFDSIPAGGALPPPPRPRLMAV